MAIDETFPVAESEPLPSGYTHSNTRARATGEFRAPRSGEWFLSGAILEAYRAHSDMLQERRIARLVVGRMVFDA